MSKLRRLQNINNVLMGVLFVSAFVAIFLGKVLVFAGLSIALFITFMTEKRIERARRRPWSQHPRMRRSIH